MVISKIMRMRVQSSPRALKNLFLFFITEKMTFSFYTTYMFHKNIKQLAKENTNYRKVIYTGTKSQLVLMNIPVGGDIGMETHPATDQILVIIEGSGKAVLNGQESPIEKHDIIFVPAGVEHNFINTGIKDLKLYTVYAPPNHPDGIIEATKVEAETKEPEQ